MAAVGAGLDLSPSARRPGGRTGAAPAMEPVRPLAAVVNTIGVHPKGFCPRGHRFCSIDRARTRCFRRGMRLSRRTLLSSLAGSALALGAGAGTGPAAEALAASADASPPMPRPGPPRGRWPGCCPATRDQVTFRTLARAAGRDRFRVSGGAGRILVEGSTPAVQLTGFHWYLRHVAHAHISWAGEQTSLPATLPPVPAPHREERPTSPTASPSTTPTTATPAPSTTGRTGSASSTSWPCTATTRCWSISARTPSTTAPSSSTATTTPSCAPGSPDPRTSPGGCSRTCPASAARSRPQLLDERAELAARVVARLRELGMNPVLPGYFGTVPPGFADREPGRARGAAGRLGRLRPARLARPAHRRLRPRRRDLLPRTGRAARRRLRCTRWTCCTRAAPPATSPIGEAARAVEAALRAAHPEALWTILGWQNNPQRAIIEAVDRIETVHRRRALRPLPLRHRPREDVAGHAVRLRLHLELRRPHGDGRQHPRLGVPVRELAYQAGQRAGRHRAHAGGRGQQPRRVRPLLRPALDGGPARPRRLVPAVAALPVRRR